MQISSLSLQYVKVPISVTKNGNVYDPTGDVVTMAFTAVGTSPVNSDWKTASWETISTGPITIYRSCCIVGPGGGTLTLSSGTYSVWAKITDSPEVPVLKASDTLVVF